MTEKFDLIPGGVYKRTRLHERFGGQRQGGISTPADAPLVLLFSNDSGAVYGYTDGFQPDGSFCYTGEGQVGDMAFVREIGLFLNIGSMDANCISSSRRTKQHTYATWERLSTWITMKHSDPTRMVIQGRLLYLLSGWLQLNQSRSTINWIISRSSVSAA